MNDARLVRVIERAGELHEQATGELGREGAALEHALERLALEQFHHDERDPALGIDPRIVHLHDVVAVADDRRDLGLLGEKLHELGAIAELGVQHLERTGAPRGAVGGAVDHRHPAFVDHLLDDVVTRDDVTGAESGGLGGGLVGVGVVVDRARSMFHRGRLS